jgi:hypothetical protein
MRLPAAPLTRHFTRRRLQAFLCALAAIATMSRQLACVMMALGVMLLAVAPARAASAPIYKCLDNHLGLVYTDLPCKDGEKLDLRAGDADPVAVARLERVREQLDQSALQRMSDERRAAEQLALAERLRRDAEDDRGAAYMAAPSALAYPYFVYPRFVDPHAQRLRLHKPREMLRFAPVPPYIVPRP